MTPLTARAERRKQRIVAHRARDHEDAERWDLAFWQKQPPEARLSALVAIHRDVEAVEKARHGRGR